MSASVGNDRRVAAVAHRYNAGNARERRHRRQRCAYRHWVILGKSLLRYLNGNGRYRG
ncbi:MAG: hypothetical protein WAK31_07025 [Chthoniobacterales bacterium]